MINNTAVFLFMVAALVSLIMGIDLKRKGKYSPISQVIKHNPFKGGTVNINQSMQSLLPLVIVAYPEDVRFQTERKLNWAGIENITAMELLALKLTAAIGIPIIGALIGALIGIPYIWFIILAGLGYLFPDMWVSSKVTKRQKEIRRDMDEFCTLFAIVMKAGGDIHGALQQVGRWFGGEIGKEVMKAAHDIATGKRRSDALMDMANRCGVDELTQMVQVILQADRYGTPIADAINQYVSQVRVMRRYAAEKVANEASVKMVFPMLLFFVGPTMFMLAYPAFKQFGRML